MGKSSLDVVVIPLYWKERPEEMERVLSRSQGLVKALRAAGVKAVADVDTAMMPGAKFRHWEERRVKLRVEVGPKEVARRAAILAVVTEPGSVATRSEHLGKEALVEAALEALRKLRRKVKPRKSSGKGGGEEQESAADEQESAEDEQESAEGERESAADEQESAEDEQESAEREVEERSDSDFEDEGEDVDSEQEKMQGSEETGPVQKPVEKAVERKAMAGNVAATTAGTATRVAAPAAAGSRSGRKLDPRFTRSGDDLDDDFDQLAGSSDEEDKAAKVAPKPAAKKRGPPKEVIF
ncbi:hypothetical protein H632_c1185p0 [Helicosporidium sp. ATCC 50920]|nr:hypothetical protein H632_c1185p0 [Helicosporidium sp. ATCC 50920]|eukprot:KDD74610.1 hypothetical protein H632_c1185p0 [Helicosporidium sp. ATCC 50920]